MSSSERRCIEKLMYGHSFSIRPLTCHHHCSLEACIHALDMSFFPVLEASSHYISAATSSAQKKMCIPVRSCIWHCTWKVCYLVLMQSWVPFHGEGLSHLQKIVWCGKLLFRSSGDFTEFLVWVLTSQILLTEFSKIRKMETNETLTYRKRVEM